MAATPKTSTLTFTSADGKRDYVYTIYNSDVANAFAKWSRMRTALSTDVDFVTVPEDMYLSDISSITGIVDTKMLLLFLDDGAVPGKLIYWENTISTNPNRAFPEIKIRAGRKLQFQVVA